MTEIFCSKKSLIRQKFSEQLKADLQKDFNSDELCHFIAQKTDIESNNVRM